MSSDEDREEFVKVCEPDGEAVELPVEGDDTLLLATLQGQFPNAVGLRYQSSSGSWRGVRIVDEKLKPPAGGWGFETVYQVTLSTSGLKRKTTDMPEEEEKQKEEEENEAKSPKVEDPESPLMKKPKSSRDEKKYLGDLILLGLPPDCRGEDLKEYFTAACGELSMHEVKTKSGRDGVRSRGFGFVRFKTVEGTKAALTGEHSIMGKTIKIKLSKKKEDPMKLFVGRIPEDISKEEVKEHFEEFGDVREVYLPQPRRGFGFVTFRHSVDGFAALKKSHKLGDTKLNVEHAEEKYEKAGRSRRDEDRHGMREERRDYGDDYRRDRRDFDRRGGSRHHDNRGDSRRDFRDDRGYNRNHHANQRVSDTYGRNEQNQTADQLKTLLFSILGNN